MDMLITETNKLVAKVYHIQHLSTLLLPLPGMIFLSKGSVQQATGKHGNAGTEMETGMETT